MATQEIDEILDGMLDGLAALMNREGLDFGQAIKAFLTASSGPMRKVTVTMDDEGGMEVAIDEAEPEPDVDMDERTEARLQGLGIDTDLVRIAARSVSFQDYVTRKARLARGRR